MNHRVICLFGVKPLAHYIVTKCSLEDRPTTNLQLQKILYFLQFVYCRKHKGEALLFPETFYAWPYGPVIPSVYDEFSEYGGRFIGKNFDDKPDCTDSILEFLDEGIDTLRRRSPWDLVRISHAPGSPWHQVYRDGAGYKREIDYDLFIESACVGLSDDKSI